MATCSPRPRSPARSYGRGASSSVRRRPSNITACREDGYQEEGGGDALDLAVDKRKSDELAVTGLLIAGFEMGGMDEDEGYFRFEAEAGRRQIVGGSLGKTSARFADGESFVLTPEERQSGWVGRLRAIGGDVSFRVAGEVGAEEREDKVGLSARATVSLGSLIMNGTSRPVIGKITKRAATSWPERAEARPRSF